MFVFSSNWDHLEASFWARHISSWSPSLQPSWAAPCICHKTPSHTFFQGLFCISFPGIIKMLNKCFIIFCLYLDIWAILDWNFFALFSVVVSHFALIFVLNLTLLSILIMTFLKKHFTIKTLKNSKEFFHLFVLSFAIVFLQPLAILFILDVNFKILKALTPLALLTKQGLRTRIQLLIISSPWLFWTPVSLLGRTYSGAQARLCRSPRESWHILSPSCFRICSQEPSGTPSESCIRKPPREPSDNCWQVRHS